MTQNIIIFVGAIALSAGLFLGGCGPSLQQQQIMKECMSNCNLEMMSCLESSTCVDIDGHQIPCEAECERKKSECESNCPG